jgi:hypothetical protein
MDLRIGDPMATTALNNEVASPLSSSSVENFLAPRIRRSSAAVENAIA